MLENRSFTKSHLVDYLLIPKREWKYLAVVTLTKSSNLILLSEIIQRHVPLCVMPYGEPNITSEVFKMNIRKPLDLQLK